LLEISKFPPRTKGGTPSCQEIVWRGDEIDLDKIPVLHCWPEVGGPYLTMTAVVSKDPARGIRNVGMYRVQQIGKREVAMHWQRHKTGAEHLRQMAERGEKMPVCIIIGSDPASMYAASAPLPPNIDEFLFAGFLRREPVRLAKAVSNDLEVPADAEFVIEWYIDPAEALIVEGPFGDANSNLVSSRLTYTVTPRMFVAALVQYQSRFQSVSTNLRFRWEYQLGSELFVVYSDGRTTVPERPNWYPEMQNRSVVVKLTKLFRW
jgi:UbiD family decarboxylase